MGEDDKTITEITKPKPLDVKPWESWNIQATLATLAFERELDFEDEVLAFEEELPSLVLLYDGEETVV